MLLTGLRWNEGKKKKTKEKRKETSNEGLAGMTLAGRYPESYDHSSGQTKRARESSDSLSSSTNLPQKRGRHDVAYGKQGGKAKEMMAGSNTPTSYAGAVKASNQKLTITRKESEGDGGMDNKDLREDQSASTKTILCADPGFLDRIEGTFIFKGKVMTADDMQEWEDLGLGKTGARGHFTVLGSSSRLRCKRP